MITGRSIYIWHLSAILDSVGSVDAIVDQAIRAKITNIWVKIADASSPSPNVLHAEGDDLQDLVTKCAARSISVFGWHVPSCRDDNATDTEVALVTRLVADFKLAGLVIDNEDGKDFFHGTAATAARYGAALQKAMHTARKILLMSSNDIISYHPNARAIDIGKYIDVNAPQVYYGQSASVAKRLAQAVSENNVIHAPFYPVGTCVVEGVADARNEGGFTDPVKCADWTRNFIALVSSMHYTSFSAYPGYGFWCWDSSPEEFWQVLYDTEVFVTPSANTSHLMELRFPDLLSTEAGPTGRAVVNTDQTAWTLQVRRIRSDHRRGEGYDRTVGTYQVLHNGVPQHELSGMTVERQGPGDNGLTGKIQHRCIVAGSYPLHPQSSAKYHTSGYATNGSHPRPALDVGNTGKREGILVHPADGYGSTIGCINLAGPLPDEDADLDLLDSVGRVVAVIEDLRVFCGGAFRFNQDGSIIGANIEIQDKADLRTMELIDAAGGARSFAMEVAAEDCLIYEQSTGRMLVREGGKSDSIGIGYSGSLSKGGRNDPARQCEKSIGPIPRGRYDIGRPVLGPSPYSLPLTPASTNDMCGRSGFLIHGDSTAHPGNASDGCIILSRPEREAIVKTALKLLIVTARIST